MRYERVGVCGRWENYRHQGCHRWRPATHYKDGNYTMMYLKIFNICVLTFDVHHLPRDVHRASLRMTLLDVPPRSSRKMYITGEFRCTSEKGGKNMMYIWCQGDVSSCCTSVTGQWRCTPATSQMYITDPMYNNDGSYPRCTSTSCFVVCTSPVFDRDQY